VNIPIIAIESSTDSVYVTVEVPSPFSSMSYEPVCARCIQANSLGLAAKHPAIQKLAKNGKPVLNLMTTAMGYGVDFMMNNHKWHGSAPNEEEFKKAMAQLEETLGDF